jgi:hypothetical protein
MEYSISAALQPLVSLKAAFLQKSLVGPFFKTILLLSSSLCAEVTSMGFKIGPAIPNLIAYFTSSR